MKKLILYILLLCNYSSFAQFVPDYIPKDGLLAWYPFNADVTDQSGNSRDLFIDSNFAQYFNDRCDNPSAAFLHINNSFVHGYMPNIQDLLAPFPLTVSIWVKGDISEFSSSYDNFTLLGNYLYDYFPTNTGWYIGIEPISDSVAYPVFSYARQPWSDCSDFNGLTQSCLDPRAPSAEINVLDGEWHLLTYKVDELGGVVYIDGLPVSNQNWVGQAGPSSLGVQILWFAQVSTFTNGLSIDDVAFWNRSLSDEEVLKLYTGNKCLDFITDCSFVNLNDFLNAGSTSVAAPSECFKACPNSRSTYFFTPKDSSSYTWEIIGGSYTVQGGGNTIDVSWSDSTTGFIILNEFRTNQQVKTYRFCVDILETPVAGFEFDIIEPCKNSPVKLVNTSSQASDYLWDFGDGNISTEVAPTHQFSQEGTYTVTLYASKNNLDSVGNALCTCYDTIKQNITINPIPAVDVYCNSTICSKDSVYYWTSATNCQQYQWTVIDAQGQIVPFTGQGTDSIFVQWGKGPNGTVRLDVVSCDEPYCSQPTTVEVDIVTDSIPIVGDVRVCEQSIEVYKVKKWATVDYQWEVIGGEIISGQGTSELKVLWDTATTNAQLKLSYSSSFLGGLYEQNLMNCSGSTSLNVEVFKKYSINLPTVSTHCAEGTSVITATTSPWPFYNWTITPSVPFTGQGTDSIFIQWDSLPTRYLLTAIPTDTNQYCNFFQSRLINTVKLFEVKEIVGPLKICPNQTYAYNVISSNSNVGSNWQVTGGEIIFSSPHQVSIKWDSIGPYSISVQQYFLFASDCVTEVLTISLEPIIFDNNWSIIGSEACPSTSESYNLNFDLGPNYVYKWKIQPENMGSITQGQGTTSVEVKWGTISGPVTLSVDIELCGLTYPIEKQMFLSEVPTPTIQQLGDFCPGKMVGLDAGPGYTNYYWSNLDTSQVITISTAGDYSVTVANANGCTATDQFSTINLPSPVAKVTKGPLEYCVGTVGSFTIRAVKRDGYKFRWFRDNIYLPTPFNQDTFVHSYTNVPGAISYWVEVTNDQGCVANSDTFLVKQFGCGGGCPSEYYELEVDVISQLPDCNSIDFDVTKSNNVTITNWDFNDNPNTLNTGVYPDAQHHFDSVGAYIVKMYYQVPSVNSGTFCGSFFDMEVQIPLNAEFYFSRQCREFEFYDYSTYLGEDQPIAWSWDFGDGSSSSLKNPSHTFASEGDYLVSLTVMNAQGCTSTYNKEVHVDAELSAQIIANPSQACEGQPVQFTTNVNGIKEVLWSFGNGQTSTEFDPIITFSPAGVYQISVMVKDTFGCSDTAYLDLIVNSYVPLSIDTISWSPSLGICVGDSVLLTAPGGLGFQYYWSDNSSGSQIVVQQSGNYSVTILDSTGCKHELAPITVTVSNYPSAAISGNRYLCGNGCITIETEEVGGNNYVWYANGAPIPASNKPSIQICKPTLSSPYTVEVTNVNGCSTLSSPFQIEAAQIPEFEIQGTPKLCEGEIVRLSIVPTLPNVVYSWNTGVVDTVIQVLQKGFYTANGLDTVTGCSFFTWQKINPLPDLCYMPFGCYETCNPDTLFLPNIPDKDSVTWYHNGNVVSNHFNFLEVVEDGTYSVEVVTIHGCSDRSKDVSIDIVSGFGSLTANLWSDVNDNGLVDALDTLVSGFPLMLSKNGVFIDTLSSLDQEAILWQKLLGGEYGVVVDTANLPMDWVAVIGQDSFIIESCDQSLKINLLVDYVCPNLQTTIELSACEGEVANYQGNSIPAGGSQVFTYQTNFGCDSVVSVQVLVLSNDSATVTKYICPGDTVIFQGVTFTGPTSEVFHLITQQGCDSTLVLQVNEYPTYSSSIEVAICDGEQFFYQNTGLFPGQSQQFVLQSVNGCDSLVLVQVAALPSSADTLVVSVCPGSTYSYQNIELSVGQAQLFSFTNSVGCDSTILVEVNAFPSYSQTQEIYVCPGETYTFQGQQLNIGQSQSFSLISINGCDSTVLVQVKAYQSSSDTLEVSVCNGESFSYNNQLFQGGTEQVFQYANSWGCDSTILLQVRSYPELNYQYKSEPTCPNIETGRIEIGVTNGTSIGISYSINGSVFDTISTYRYLEEGIYTIRVQDANGCIQEKAVSVSAYPPLDVILPDEIVVPCDSNEIEVTPSIIGDTTNLELIWSNGTRGSSFFASEIGPLTVHAKNGCKESVYKTTQIQWVDELREPVPIYVPNVFSPYGQSPENSVFRTFFGPNFVIESYRLEVYDRFGSLVFVTEDESGEWSGEYNNRRVPDGVYVWKVEANVRICGKQRKVQRSGDVTIVR